MFRGAVRRLMLRVKGKDHTDSRYLHLPRTLDPPGGRGMHWGEVTDIHLVQAARYFPAVQFRVHRVKS